MGLPKTFSRLFVRPALRRMRKSTLTTLLRLLFLAVVCAVAGRFATADPMVVITDLTEDPVTATVSGSINPGDNYPKIDRKTGEIGPPLTAPKDTPEKLSFSISVDGTGGGSGVAVLFEGANLISDLLEVTVTQKFRGPQMNIPYLDISGTFTSDVNPNAVDLNLPDEIMKKVIANGLVEDGTQQDIGSQLIDTTTGKALAIGDLTITAASDIPEPSSLVLQFTVAAIAIGLKALRRRRALSRTLLETVAGVGR